MSAHSAQTEAVVFGERYWLTQELAVGGMAEVFLAKHQTPEGFCKDVVIKRLKPALAQDPRVVAMFRDEARVSGMLNHGNTVHVFDSGTQDGLPFMAMEYIRGEELNMLCRRGIGCGEFLPLEHAVELVRQAALGMGYYHNLRDGQGRALDLVHCDISPNNLLVGQDGYLQIIDFGISQHQGQQYRDGQLVPGKLSYMSPEQARRSTLDHRSDIFSLGVVLYEITLGQRLFRGPASEVLPRLLRCEVQAPTFVRHDYPGALESIVMRALEAEPSDRYQEAYDFADALGSYLREEAMRTGPIGIARYIDRLRVAEGGRRRDELISEAEEEDEDALDFDRGLFSGFKAMAAQDPRAAEAWEEVEEDEAAIADVLGIDIGLVRTASRTSDSDAEPAEAPDAGSPRAATPTPTASADSAATPTPRADSAATATPSADSASVAAAVSAPSPAPSSSPVILLLVMLAGMAIGIAGAVLAGALG